MIIVLALTELTLTLTCQGWDPIFEFDGETFAEMDKQKKNSLSHRAIALGKLKDWLEERQ